MPLTLSGTSGVLDNSGAFVRGTAVNSTSGTSIDFTGIPSWVKRVTVMFVGVSTNGSSPIQIQIGSSGGVLTSGYLGTGVDNITGTSVTNMSSGFLTSASGNIGSASVRHGLFTITNFNGNTWVMAGSANLSNTPFGAYASGSNSSLGATLDRIRITTVNGTDTFDAGSINILYE
jgi:hypothetical protein